MYKLNSVKEIPENLKIIDWERKGNVVRFYFGDKDCNDYWGDDWDDAPYDCNAENVSLRYVKFVIDVAFGFDTEVYEPCDGELNCGLCKDDFKTEHTPFLLIVPKELFESYSWSEESYRFWLGTKDVIKLYFNMSWEELFRILMGSVCHLDVDLLNTYELVEEE